jgi:hypothetical protein
MLCLSFHCLSAQLAIDTTHNDTARLVVQKDNIITAATYYKSREHGWSC